ncbi:MAG: hypothetical protein SFY67_02210 [Candidatus Melainabacteria bacterium]|nr:hypothetical protein [Candidatus Melainabacteria bacterium]
MNNCWPGFFLVALSALSAILYGVEYSNPFTISFSVLAYLYWTFLVLQIHLRMRKIDNSYPFDPGDSMLGSLIPFVYIFWNAFWVSEIFKWFGQTKSKALAYGSIVAALSLIAYPDNLDRIPGSMNLIALCGLFGTIAIIERKVKSRGQSQS